MFPFPGDEQVLHAVSYASTVGSACLSTIGAVSKQCVAGKVRQVKLAAQTAY